MGTTTATRTWLHNPATGELARVNSAAGRRLDVDLWLQPGAAVARAHFHEHSSSASTCSKARWACRSAGPSASRAPATGPSRCRPARCTTGGTPATASPMSASTSRPPTGCPGSRRRAFSMIEAMWSLGALGRVNAKGLADPLWMAAIAREYRDAIRFTSPPAAVQTMVLGPVAAIARRTGRDPLKAELHAACAIPDPDEDGLAAILARPVGAAAARGRQPR